VLTVAHQKFLEMELRPLLKQDGVLYDVKGIIKEAVEARL